MSSLYEEMKKNNDKRLDITKRNDCVYPSRLLKDIKDGKDPEKKHKTLGHFLNKKSF
jgi:thioredoxin-related protein